MSGPRIPLSQMNGGNKRPTNLHRMSSTSSTSSTYSSSPSFSSSVTPTATTPPYTEKPVNAQHDDLIKFICESWERIAREGTHGTTVTYYQEAEPNPVLKDFEPFDLEAWWGQRSLQNLTTTQPQHS